MSFNVKLPEYEIARLYKDSMIIYKVIEYPRSKTKRQLENEKNLRNNVFHGYLSIKAKSRIKKILSPWLNSVIEYRKKRQKRNLSKQPYLTFVTLTLPAAQKHDDCQIKRVALNHFLITIQRKFNVQAYFWICETQKNGNLHFHIIIDSFIKWQELRKIWNISIEKLGYVTDFEKLHNHRNPNSTDIHQLDNVESIENYVVKYTSKGGGVRIIRGKIWGCSKNIKNLKPYEQIIDSDMNSFIAKVNSSAHFRKYEDEQVTVFSGDILGFSSVHAKEIHNKILKHWEECLEEVYMNRWKKKLQVAKQDTKARECLRIINRQPPQLQLNFQF